MCEQLATADWECRKAETNCPGLSVAHQRDTGIKMSLLWSRVDQCDFEACLHLTSGDKIFLTSVLKKKDISIILSVNWLKTSLCGELFDMSSTEIVIRLVGELQQC